MIAGKGSPTVQYVTLYQIKKLGVDPGGPGAGGVKKVHTVRVNESETAG
jgi:hypothetical protein